MEKKYDKEYAQKNKEKIAIKGKEYYIKNKAKILTYRKKYANKNKEKIKEYKKAYTQKEKPWRKDSEKERVKQLYKNPVFIEKRKKYTTEKYNKNATFRISRLLRSRIWHSLKGIGKTDSTIKLLGCNINDFKTHLLKTAIQNGYKDFDINNLDGKTYHIDHIIPCSLWNLKCSYHQYLCFNYSNMQILKAEENLKKHNKI